MLSVQFCGIKKKPNPFIYLFLAPGIEPGPLQW